MYLCMYVSFGIYIKLIDGTNRFRKAHSLTAQHNPTAVSPKNTWFKNENSVSFLVFIINLRTVFVSVNASLFLLRIYSVFLIDFCFVSFSLFLTYYCTGRFGRLFCVALYYFRIFLLIASVACIKQKQEQHPPICIGVCVLRAMRKYIHMLTHVRISTVQTH